MLGQRHRAACISLRCPDGALALQLGCGGMVGYHGGPKEFMAPFADTIAPWVKEMNEIPINDVLPVRSHFTRKTQDVGITMYVDDVRKKHVLGKSAAKSKNPGARSPHTPATGQ